MTKATKAAVHYRKATGPRRCGNCRSMNPDGTCDKVQGVVTRTMVCDRWTPMKAKK